MRHLTLLTLSCSLLLSVAEAPAQTPVRLSVEEAISRGIQASHRLAEIGARQAASAAVVDVRRSAGMPVLTLQAGYTRTNHVKGFSLPNPSAPGQVVTLYSDVPDNVRTRIDLQWPIYMGGRTDALARAARAEADAVGHDRQAAQADLKLEITRAYWSLVTAGASVRVLEQALARLDAHLTAVRDRQQAGLVPPSDVMLSEAQRSRQQMLLIEARNLKEVANDDLRRLVGLPSDAVVEANDALAPPPPPAALPAALVGQARAGRPERQAIEARIASADRLRRAANAGRLPSLAFEGGFDYARPNPSIFPRTPNWKDSWDLSVNMNWSLWDGGRAKAEAAQALANRRAAEEGLLEFDSTLESDIRQQRLNLESALAAITAADDAVRSATEARREVSDRYAAGIATNTDALDAQVALLQSELDRTRAVAEARLAAARLDRVLGR
jgi:outer membrane protein